MNDVPTVSMLTELEHFLFTQRQRWFLQGRLYAWTIYERVLTQNSRGHADNDMDDGTDPLVGELRASMKRLEERNKQLEDTLQRCRERISDLEGEKLSMELDDDTAYYDPERETYDQHALIASSLTDPMLSETLSAELPQPNFKTANHFIWTMDDYKTPVPLGKMSNVEEFGEETTYGFAWRRTQPGYLSNTAVTLNASLSARRIA
ncbi:hypothetical protein AURDEDRAFT_165498 [Auricularia subglabra TFB-10046 SS5]|nr:hypothetical protein AURDEDRAFT_165498 [Auricularia subglabra TFB-10046 SS5]